MPAAAEPLRILGIDPSLRGTGWGVVEMAAQGGLRALACGVVANPAALSPQGCLLRIFETLEETIAAHRPTHAATERTIFVQNRQSAISLGTARGAVLLAVARAGLPLLEFAPAQIKAAATGHGGARKDQIAIMIRALLRMEATPPPDAADALGAAIAAAHTLRTASRREVIKPVDARPAARQGSRRP